MFLGMTKELEDRRRNFKKLRSYPPAKPIEIDGEWFFPFSLAAKRANVSHVTLFKWVSRGQTPNGWLLQAFQDLERRHFISEKSLRLLENRFVDVQTGKPVGNVFLRRADKVDKPIPDGKESYCSTSLAA